MVPFGARRAPHANALPTGASTTTAVIPATTRRRTVRVRAMATPFVRGPPFDGTGSRDGSRGSTIHAVDRWSCDRSRRPRVSAGRGEPLPGAEGLAPVRPSNIDPAAPEDLPAFPVAEDRRALVDPDEPGRVWQTRGHPPGEPRDLRRAIPMDAERRMRDDPQPEEPRAPTGPVPRAAHDHRSGAASGPDRAAVHSAEDRVEQRRVPEHVREMLRLASGEVDEGGSLDTFRQLLADRALPPLQGQQLGATIRLAVV